MANRLNNASKVRPPRIADPELLGELHRAMRQGALSIRDVSRLLRAEKGLSQADFARALKVGQEAIKAMESGRGNPSLRTLEKLARINGLRVALIAADAPSVTLVSSASLAREKSRRRKRVLDDVASGRKSLVQHHAESALRIEGATFYLVTHPK